MKIRLTLPKLVNLGQRIGTSPKRRSELRLTNYQFVRGSEHLSVSVTIPLCDADRAACRNSMSEGKRVT